MTEGTSVASHRREKLLHIRAPSHDSRTPTLAAGRRPVSPPASPGSPRTWTPGWCGHRTSTPSARRAWSHSLATTGRAATGGRPRALSGNWPDRRRSGPHRGRPQTPRTAANVPQSRRPRPWPAGRWPSRHPRLLRRNRTVPGVRVDDRDRRVGRRRRHVRSADIAAVLSGRLSARAVEVQAAGLAAEESDGGRACCAWNGRPNP